MRVHVRYFAAARELCALDEEPIEVDASSRANDVLRRVGVLHPRFEPFRERMRVAVNGELVGLDHVIGEGDELVVLPPVAGGSPWRPRLAEIRTSPLSIDEVVSAVTAPGSGGIAVFLGVVRDHADGTPVSRLDYEAYVELANKEMVRIFDRLESARPGVRLAATHRIGSLGIGDVAVVAAASAPHRAEAFATCREAIDAIKATVPIWKKEWAPDGTALWVNLEGEHRG